MTAVVLRGLTAGYGVRPVLEDLDLEVPSGSFTAVLGRSGSGKSTLLRILAGFIRPVSGTVHFGDRLVAGPGRFVPPERRRVGIVPQEGALFPHLSVSANVGFGLPRQARSGVSRSRVAELLDMVGMAAFADARPHELSGGQQQRVALARALAPGPEVLLLDEPFGSLDLALRARLRAEVCGLLRALGTTAVLVTHDQDEALSIADLVGVLRDGRIVQAGAPAELYNDPADLDIARFVGEVAELPAVVEGDRVRCALGEVPVRRPGPGGPGSDRDGDAVVVLRPEQLVLSGAGAGGVVVETAYHGYDAVIRVELAAGARIPVRVPGGGTAPPRPGDSVAVGVTGVGLLYRR